MDYKNEIKNRFVCPNDRQLALRAKLKSGWSLKTESLGYQNTEHIGADEQATIISVIKRAEQVDKIEQERIGKLVERLDNLRKNALGRNPSQCLLCGDSFGILSSQKVICIDCRKYVCQKCAIDGYSPKLQKCNPKDQWLCMICAETREIWKKSGAWFFKSLPKYILPSQQNVNLNGRGRGARFSRNYKDDDSSSDDEKKLWNHKLERRNSSTESMHGNEEISQDYHYQHHHNNQITPDIYLSKVPIRMYVQSNDVVTNKLWDDYGEIKTDSTSIESSELSRRESIVSRSLSEWNWTNNITDSKSDDRISPSSSSINSNIFKSNNDDLKSYQDTSMGLMELSLTYDPVTTTLHCTVYRAKNLIPMDISGLADPFCKLNIMPNNKMSTRLKTKTVHKTRNPEFNENLTFYDISESDLIKKSMHILVVDDDKYGNDYMGETRIPLGKLRVQNTIYLSVPLENLRPEPKGLYPTIELTEWFDDVCSRGQILLSLCYSTKRRALLVSVMRCSNLLPMDNNGFSDPFVKLHLKPDPYHRKHKTTIKWKNLNPIFNEEFAFETRPNELSTQSLYITVWDKDYGKSNDYLGGLILGGLGSKGQRLKHWLDMIRYPDHRHELWHNLHEDLLND